MSDSNPQPKELDALAENMRPLETWVKRLFYIYAVAALLILFYHLVRESLTYIEFVPINGQYQSFNPLRRIGAGQSFGYDFMSYLGMGPIYVAYPLFWLLGGDPAAGNAAHFITHYLAFVAGSIFLCRLVRLPWVPTLAITLVTLTAGMKTMADTVVIIFTALLSPDMTVYGMRVFWPILAGMILYAGMTWGPLATPERRRGYGMAALVGAVAGVSPLWSNDYGLPTSIALFGYLLLAVCNWRRPLQAGLMIPVFFGTGIVAFALLLTALTKGHPTYWLDVNYSRIAGDQFWYFGVSAYDKFFSPFDIPIETMVQYGLIGMVVLGLRWLFVRDPREAIFLVIGAATFGGAILSTMGGNFDSKYFSGFNRYSIILLPYVIYIVIADLFRLTRNILKRDEPDGMPAVFKLGVRHAGGAVIIATTVWYSFGDWQDLSKPGLVSGYHLSWGRQDDSSNMMDVPELGGYIGDYFKPMVDMGRRLRAEFDRDKVPADQRLFSTYTTAMDVIAGAMNPSRDDYIIHALGDKGRAEYIKAFTEAKSRYVMTQREHVIYWEHWSQRINWFFYKELFLNYKPDDTALYVMLWKRRDVPLKPDGREVSCRIAPNADGMPTRSRLILGEDIPAGGKAGEEYWTTIDITFKLDLKEELWPIFGKRSVIMVQEMKSAMRGAAVSRAFGMNPEPGHGTIPVEHRLGSETIVQVEAFPTPRVSFAVTGCKAHLYVNAAETRPADYFGEPGKVVKLNLNGTMEQGLGLWGNVMHSPNLPRSLIIFNSPGAIRELRPGSTVKGPDCVGTRRVVDTDYRVIYLDGPPMSDACHKSASQLEFTVGTDDGSWNMPFREKMAQAYYAMLACERNGIKPASGKTCAQEYGFDP